MCATSFGDRYHDIIFCLSSSSSFHLSLFWAKATKMVFMIAQTRYAICDMRVYSASIVRIISSQTINRPYKNILLSFFNVCSKQHYCRTQVLICETQLSARTHKNTDLKRNRRRKAVRCQIERIHGPNKSHVCVCARAAQEQRMEICQTVCDGRRCKRPGPATKTNKEFRIK